MRDWYNSTMNVVIRGGREKLCVVMLGPPMSGKGTMSGSIAKAFKLEHIDLGSIIRKSDRPEVRRIVDAGGLLDDGLVIQVAAERIACSGDIVIDGFPRSIEQAKYLCALENINFLAIELQLSLDVALDRMRNRVLCASCSRPAMASVRAHTISRPAPTWRSSSSTTRWSTR